MRLAAITYTTYYRGNTPYFTSTDKSYDLRFVGATPTLELQSADFLHQVYLPDNVNKSNLVYGMMQWQYLLTFFDFKPETLNRSFKAQLKQNSVELKNKILLIQEDLLWKKDAEAMVKAIYTYPFKIADSTFIETALAERSEEYAVVRLIDATNSDGKAKAHCITGTADGKIYAYWNPYKVSMLADQATSNYVAYTTIDAKSLGGYMDIIANIEQ